MQRMNAPVRSIPNKYQNKSVGGPRSGGGGSHTDALSHLNLVMQKEAAMSICKISGKMKLATTFFVVAF